jgi:hypothetical protein
LGAAEGQEYLVRASFIQIYLEKVYDLLSKTQGKILPVKENRYVQSRSLVSIIYSPFLPTTHASFPSISLDQNVCSEGSTYVHGADVVVMKSRAELQSLLEDGKKNRKVSII